MKKGLQKLLSVIIAYRIHFIAWFFFIFYEVVISGLLRGYFVSFGNYTLFYLFNICIFYFHAHVVMPATKSNTKNRLLMVPFLIMVEVAAYVPFTLLTASILQKYTSLSVYTPVVYDRVSMGNGIWRTMYFILFSTGYYYLMNYLNQRKAIQDAEKQRLLMIIENQNIQAELIKSQHAHLKAQINPHFLFNTLSLIYSSTRKAVPEAAEAIMTLSEMMRYAMKENDEETFTSLALEIEQIENLIKLHQIKAENKLNIAFNYDPDLVKIQIIPLVIITLVENIFKHGDLSNPDDPARISIYLLDGQLIIETKNSINQKIAPVSHNIGLDNVKKRLNMVYGEQASVQMERKPNNVFKVTLTVDLNN